MVATSYSFARRSTIGNDTAVTECAMDPGESTVDPDEIRQIWRPSRCLVESRWQLFCFTQA